MRRFTQFQLQKSVRRWVLNEFLLRTTTKTISYRCVGSSITFIISFIFTGEIVVSAAISVTEFLLKPSLYWIHERVWNNIIWGKTKV
jgi:uncharacterized membrane protein